MEEQRKLFMTLLYRGIAQQLKMPSLSPELQSTVVRMYNSINPAVFKNYSATEIMPALVSVISNQLKDNQPIKKTNKEHMVTKRPVEINPYTDTNVHDDMHETLKEIVDTSTDTGLLSSYDVTPNPEQTVDLDTETKYNVSNIEINNFLGINDLPTLQLLFNPESLYVHFYVVLDSDYRITAEENKAAITKFTWAYSETQNIGVGFCNSVGRIRDVIGIRMFQPRVPYVAAMDTSAKRVSVLIEELKTQSFIGENGRRFHFLFRPDYATVGTSIELSTEDFNDGIFNFRKPITTFDSLTISFGDPLVVISFATPFDRFMIPIEFICYKSDK